MTYNNDDVRFPMRKNPRLAGFDYATPNYYFITVCTYQKACIFGKPGDLNAWGKLAKNGLLQIGEHFSGVTVDKFVVMPNHVHAIIVLSDSGIRLTTVIGQYKSYVTRELHKLCDDKIWQTSFHDHVIRNQADYERIWSYIDSNPATWLKDCFYTEES